MILQLTLSPELEVRLHDEAERRGDQAEESEDAEEFFRQPDADRPSNRPLFPTELRGISS
jgi:hypothetical protein